MMPSGHEIEEYARRLAAGLGVPDFVYRPANVRKGSGTREVSDGLLVAGGRGLILQVKSRDGGAAVTDTVHRAARWVIKNAGDGKRQADGTRRSLCMGGRFLSMRGFERFLPPASDWPAVVLIDHPSAPNVELPRHPDTMWLTMADWLDLHFRLRSTAAVIAYVHRALTTDLHPRLADERLRYERLARADADYASRSRALPILSLKPLTDEEILVVALFDDLVERVADPTNTPWDRDQYLYVVELLDSQPVLLRVEIGRKMLRTWQTVRAKGDRRGFLALDRQVGDRIVFLYDIGDENKSDFDEITSPQLRRMAPCAIPKPWSRVRSVTRTLSPSACATTTS